MRVEAVFDVGRDLVRLCRLLKFHDLFDHLLVPFRFDSVLLRFGLLNFAPGVLLVFNAGLRGQQYVVLLLLVLLLVHHENL